jgi:anti-sigma factor RsiW
MTCNDFQERLSAFTDGELSDRESAEVFTHAGTCRRCRDFLGSLVRVRSAISRLPVLQPDPGLEDRIVGLQERKETAGRSLPAGIHGLWMRNLRVPAAALAAGVALFLMTTAISLWLWLSPLTPPREVVYVFGLPQVEVYSTRTANGENQH